ncbi:MAG: molybdopterin-dependent oxidoreductase [Burkholderiaceae bacterium]
MIPPGQKSRLDFPRFGLPAYAKRFPSNTDQRTIVVAVNGVDHGTIDVDSSGLERINVQSDFHCVTTWSYLGANWAGVRFADFYQKCVIPLLPRGISIAGAVLSAQDGYRTTLMLEDLLSSGVMLVDSLDGQPLSIEHGAPLRLVAPQHYGYKNSKHLKRIEFFTEMPVIKRGVSAFLDHPRARVAKEERGRWVPGWILRYVYRFFISRTERNFRSAMQKNILG